MSCSKKWPHLHRGNRNCIKVNVYVNQVHYWFLNVTAKIFLLRNFPKKSKAFSPTSLIARDIN